MSKKIFLVLLIWLFLTSLGFSQTVIKSFVAPGDNATWGLTVGGNFGTKYLWSASVSETGSIIYQLDTAGNVLSSFSWPHGIVSGLAWQGLPDDDAVLWIAEAFTGNIYKALTSGEELLKIESALADVAGLALENSNLWVIDRGNYTVNQIDTGGNVVTSFSIGTYAGNPSGLTWDGSAFWMCESFHNHIIQLTKEGELLQSFSGPGTNAIELEWDGSHLWVSDIVTDRIYKLQVSTRPQPGLLFSWRALDIEGALAPPPYGLRLDGFFDNKDYHEVTFSFDSVLFDEFEDGTAHLFGTLKLAEWNNTGGPGDYASDWDLDVWFKSAEAPAGADPDWRFYEIIPDPIPAHKEMLNQDNSKDFTDFWTYPADLSKPFQVGFGANEKNDHYGAAGWLSFLHVDSCDTTGKGPGKYIDACDLLMDLVAAHTDVSPEKTKKPGSYSLLSNYPNPFNAQTQIKYYLRQESSVKLVIYNVLGQKIKVLVNGKQTRGEKRVTWDGKDESGSPVASGVYFYQLVTQNESDFGKMTLLK